MAESLRHGGDHDLRRGIGFVPSPYRLWQQLVDLVHGFDEGLVVPAGLFEDDLLPDALEILLAENRASISLLQRRLRIGYTRSARIVDLLVEKGVIGPSQPGGQTREVNREAALALLRRAASG